MMRSLITTGSPNWYMEGVAEPQICVTTIGPALAALPFQAIGYLAHAWQLIDRPSEQILIRFTLLGTVFYTALWMCVLAQLCIVLGSTRRRAIVLSLIVGAGTLIFPYSKSAQGENVVGLCITAIVLLLVYAQKTPRSRYFIGIGLLYGFLLSCKIELAAVFPLLLIAAVVSGAPAGIKGLISNWRAWTALAVGIVPGVGIIMGYNYLRYGGISNSGYLPPETTVLTLFNHPFWKGLYLQMFSPGKGIFWYCPVLLASFPLLWIFLRKQRRIILLPYCWWAIMTCVYALWYTPPGDTALGSRFQVSYLPFLILPLLALPSLTGLTLLTYKTWARVCIFVSVVLQVLFCMVSFNIDYHRKLFSVEVPDRLAYMYTTYYSFADSLLAGFFTTAREGLLDMYFVRLRPLESALTILPAFWWILAGSACAFSTAFYFSRNAINTHPGHYWTRLLRYQWPALCLAVLGITRTGHPGENGLRLKMDNPVSASHKTIVQDIAIDNLNNGREVYKVASPFNLQWSGKLYCPHPGNYSFLTSSNRPLKITLAGHERATVAGRFVTDITVDNKGWKSIDIICSGAGMLDNFMVECRFPGEEAYKPLSSVKLRH